MVTQFTVHNNLPENSPCPIHPMFQLYGKCLAKQPLTREEKDKIANSLYGIMGGADSTYKRGGFSARFSNVLPRILVNYRYYGWSEYYAPDKTSLRKALGSNNVIEMIETKTN